MQPFNGASGWTAAQISALLSNVAWSGSAAFGIDTANGNSTYNGSVVTTNGNSVSLSMPSGMPLAKAGASALTIVGNGPYNGGTTLFSGQLNIGGPSALGTGPLTINGGTIDNASGADMTLSGNNAQNWYSGFTYAGAANSLNLGLGTVNLTNPNEQAMVITVNGNTLTVGGPIDAYNNGYGGLTKQGNGTLVLNGNNNIQYGYMTINGGALTLGGTNNFNGRYGYGTILNAGQLNINNPSGAGRGGFDHQRRDHRQHLRSRHYGEPALGAVLERQFHLRRRDEQPGPRQHVSGDVGRQLRRHRGRPHAHRGRPDHRQSQPDQTGRRHAGPNQQHRQHLQRRHDDRRRPAYVQHQQCASLNRQRHHQFRRRLDRDRPLQHGCRLD